MGRECNRGPAGREGDPAHPQGVASITQAISWWGRAVSVAGPGAWGERLTRAIVFFFSRRDSPPAPRRRSELGLERVHPGWLRTRARWPNVRTGRSLREKKRVGKKERRESGRKASPTCPFRPALGAPRPGVRPGHAHKRAH